MIAGPRIIPQKPKVESPAMIAKKISSSFIFVGTFANVFMYFIISGFIKVSAMIDMTMIEYKAIVTASMTLP